MAALDLSDVRARLDQSMSRRWTRMAREVKRAIVMHDALGLGPKSPTMVMPADHKADLFQRWLDERLMAGVIGRDAGWLKPHIDAASTRAMRQGLADFDPDEPRDESGKWSAGGSESPRQPHTSTEWLQHINAKEHKRFLAQAASGPLTFYHGTAVDAVKAIKKRGIVPHGGAGADTWMLWHGGSKQQLQVGDDIEGAGKLNKERLGSVYITDDLDTAKTFANTASEVHSHTGATVLKVTIPADRVNDVVHDELALTLPAYRFHGKIDPKWVSVAETPPYGGEFETKMGGLKQPHHDAAPPLVLYLVVQTDESQGLADFDPDEPRDDKGKWTAGQGGHSPGGPYLVPTLRFGGKSYTPKRSDDWSHRGVFVGLDPELQGPVAEGLENDKTEIGYTTPDGFIDRFKGRAYAEANGLLAPHAYNQRDLISEQVAPAAADPTHVRFNRAAAERGMTAVSPSTTDTDFAGALKGLAGEKQAKFEQASAEIDKGLGIEGAKSVGVIGAWQDGAENALVTTTAHTGWDQLETSAAMKAHLANQKAALVFHSDPDGHAVLYTMHAQGDAGSIHQGLLADGVAFHSIEPDADGQGATVHIADLDGSAYDSVAKSAERFNAKVDFATGRAAFIGSDGSEGSDAEQRAGARRAYEKIISESKVSGAADVWRRVHSGWGADGGSTGEGSSGRAEGSQALSDGVGDEPRDDHGRWTAGGSVSATRDKIYETLTNATGAGPFDGGCVTMARAIQKIVGGRIVVLVGNNGVTQDEKAQHAAIEKDGLIYDFSKSAPPDQFMRAFEKTEGASISHIRPMQKGDLPNAPLDEKAADKIAALMGHKFDKRLLTKDAQSNLGFIVQGAAPSAGVCHAASISALATICDDVSQRARSHVSAGLLLAKRPAQIARLLDQAFGEGLKRSRMLAEHAVTMSYSQATLDAMEARGVTHVGTLSEHSHQLRDVGPPDEPRDEKGKWTEGGGIVAYHGSPHDFSKFDLSHLGSGEGEQMFGHGIYLADVPEVAKSYSRGAAGSTKGGNLYAVNIHAKPEEFFDWDAPLSAQNQKVKNWVSARAAAGHNVPDWDAPGSWALVADRGEGKGSLEKSLLASGLPGIRYLDEKSRAAGGSRNYVVFDPSILEITHKNGVALKDYDPSEGRDPPAQFTPTLNEHSHQLTDYDEGEARNERGEWTSSTQKFLLGEVHHNAVLARVKAIARESKYHEAKITVDKDSGQIDAASGDTFNHDEIASGLRFVHGFVIHDPKANKFGYFLTEHHPIEDRLQRSGIEDWSGRPEYAVRDYDPGEGRDPHGRWTGGNGDWAKLSSEDKAGLTKRLVPAVRHIASGELTVGRRGDTHRDLGFYVENTEDVERGFVDPQSKKFWSGADVPLDSADLMSSRQRVGMFGHDAGPDDEPRDEQGRWTADAARQTPQPQHPRTGQFAKAHIVAREKRRSKKTGQFRRQGLSPDEQRKEELTEARFNRVAGELDVLTAGDDKVCKRCQEISDNGPYTISQARSLIPSHPNCRCTFVEAGSMALDAGPDDEARDPQGRWTSGGGGDVEAERAMMAIPDTHTINTPERQALRQSVEDRLYNKGVDHRSRNRQATIILGLPAAGKSTIAHPLVKNGALEIDPDSAKELLPEYKGGIGAYALHEESSMITRKLLQRALTNGDDIVWPRIDSKDKIVADVGSLKKAGYDVHLRFVDIDQGDALKAAHQRFLATGRYVSPKVIQGFGDSPRQAYQGALATGMIASHETYHRSLTTGLAKVDDAVTGDDEWAKRYRARLDESEARDTEALADFVAENYLADFSPDEPRDDSGKWTALQGSQGHGALISTANPTAKKSAGESGNYQRVDIKAMQRDPDMFKTNVDLFKNGDFYPGMRPDEVKGTTNEVATAVKGRMVDNLTFLANKVKQDDTANGTDNFKKWGGWYEGAHNIAEANAKKFGTDIPSASGTIAALSPQNDWNTNVYQAGVVSDALKNKLGAKWDAKMSATSQAIWSGQRLAMAKEIEGKTLGELTKPLAGDSPEDGAGLALARQAMWIRTENEAHSDRSFHEVQTDGSLGKMMTTQTGKPSTAAWKQVSAIANAVAAFHSNGDGATLSGAMGARHKVRSFFNNILDPHSKNGDVTVDTHAVGAAWLTPSTTSDVSVAHALASTMMRKDQPKGYKGTASSAVTGVSGTYAVYADAYREAAAQLHVEPRQLQSIVWEAKQRLFSKAQTGPKVKTAVDAVWRRFHNGEIGLKVAQREVVKAAEGSVG